MTKTIKIELTGISPLLMHAFPMVPIDAIEKKTREEQAEFSAYRIPDTRELYIPGTAIQRAFVNGAAYSKGKGRSSLQKVAAACLIVTSEYLGLGTDVFAIDSRPVVIQATKGRIMRHRPRLDSWKVSFGVDYDDSLLTAQQVRQIVDDSGKNVGLLDFRPATKGPFGRFVVTRWEV